MSETANIKNQSYLEPIICEVKTPFKQRVWEQNYEPHRGSVTIDIKESNKIKKLILAAAFYQKIELPYRFTLSAGEIVYEKRHIKTVKLTGFYLSKIDALEVQAQLSNWKTQPPPETFLDADDEIFMSEEFSRQCYFVAHRSGEQFHIDWNLADNFDVCRNPQNYSGIEWCVVDLTK